MKKQMQNFLFSPPIILVEEGKWRLVVTSFEVTNSVFNIENENNTFFTYYTRVLDFQRRFRNIY